MRLLIGLSAVIGVWATSASAEWKEYAYPDFGFAVSFPADPTVENRPYTAADGSEANEVLYSVRDGKDVYKVAVIDLKNAAISETTAIGQAVNLLRDGADIRVDIPARVNRNRGRQLSLVGKDDSHSTVAIFFADHKLYEIEGTVLAGADDPNSGDAIRFQQSLRFTGDNAGFGPRIAGRQFQGQGQFQGGQFPNGRRFQGGRRFRRDGNPGDAVPAPTPQTPANPAD